jgi:ActR/RegA family two-component response regulator/DNA-binding transcriptional ArsR family regulator
MTNRVSHLVMPAFRSVPAEADLIEAGLADTETSVLIFEGDNDDVGARLLELCQSRGCRTHRTGDVITAMNTLETDRTIGVVAVSVAKTGPDGFALVERFRRCADHAVRFIMISRHGSAEDAIRAMHLQITDYVTRPDDGPRLAMALSRAFNEAGSRKTGSSHLSVLEGAEQARGGSAGADALEEAFQHSLALMERVQSLRAERSTTAPARFKPVAVEQDEDATTPLAERRLRKLLAVQKKRAARNSFFAKGLFDDPCWDMLLDLMVNQLQGRRISVSSLCIASGVAQTTALRRISDLYKSGLVRRVADPNDGRRVFVELSEQGIAAMVQYADSV